MTQPQSSLGLAVTATPAPEEIDPAILRSEFNEIMRASEAGEFTYKGDPSDAAAKALFDESVRKRVARGIELAAILRRQNTGPAKAKPTAKGGRGKKPAIDTAAAMAELLK